MADKPTYEQLVKRIEELERAESERKRIEEALRDNEKKYRTLVANAAEAILVAQNGVFVFTNPKGEELFGCTGEELASKPLTDFLHEEDRELVRDRHERRLKGEDLPSMYPFRIIDKNGRIRWVELSVALFSWAEKPATLCFITDITKRKRAEDELKQSEERFRNLIEGSIQGVLIHRNHKPLFVNETWAGIHGYSREEVLRMDTVVPLISSKDQKRMIEYKEARLQGKFAPLDYEYQGIHKNGSFIWLDNRVRVVQFGGHEAIQTTIFDITRRKQAEAEREKLITDLQDALAKVKTLSGLLPVCSYCKKARDDKGYWNQIDAYISKHSNADVTHGICPECAERYWPDVNFNDE